MEEFNSADILRNQNRKKRLATLEVGLFEVSFVLIIIIVLFGTLNYFNILSLSKLYPNQFGFLPHQKILKIPTSSSGSFLTATDTQIQEYTNYVNQKGLAKPTIIETKSQTWEADGLYAGYQNDTIKIVTADGLLELKLLPNSTFQTISLAPNPIATQSGSFSTSPKYNSETFKKTLTLGKFIQAYYTKETTPNMNISSIIYYPGLK